MRPAEVIDADIISAGVDLLAAGRNITGFALRKSLGGGSAPRLRQVWDDHINSQSQPSVEPLAELPIEVADELKQLSQGLVQRMQSMALVLNDKAVKAAERRVSELVKSVGVQREQAESELADASVAVDELEAQLETAAKDNVLLKSTVDELNTVVQKQAVEVAQLSERLAAQEHSAQVASKQAASEAKKTVEALEAVKAEAAKTLKAREEVARSSGHIEALDRQVKELMAKVVMGPKVA